MSLWKHRDFMMLWASQAISEIGSRITREALPMGMVLMMGVTPFTMGLLSLTASIPASLFGLFIGMWVDRFSRRPLMITADLSRAVLLFLLPVAALTGVLQLWMFFVVAALTSIFTLLFDVSYTAYLPMLIDHPHLAEGNSKLGVTSSIAEVMGPGLTGVLVQILTVPIAVGFDAFSYVFSAISIWRIRFKESKRNTNHGSQMEKDPEDLYSVMWNWKQEIATGLKTVRQSPILIALTGAAAMFSFSSSTLFVLDTLYALRTLGLSPLLFGITVTTGGIGSLIGAALFNKVLRSWGVGMTMTATLTFRGVSALCWVMAGGPVWKSTLLLIVAQLLGDSSGMIYGILDTTLRQTLVSNQLLGRVNATIRVMEVGLTAVGSFLAGIVAQEIGIRDMMAAAAIGILLTAFWLILSPIRKLRDIPAPAETIVL